MNIQTANKLQQLRKEKGYTQESLAEALGISRQAVSKWERAEASPDTDNLICLAKLYNISLDELLDADNSYQDIKEDNVSENKEATVTDKTSTKQKQTNDIIFAITSFVAVAIYIFIGFKMNLWHPGWIIFILIPIVPSIYDAIIEKKITSFNYPCLVVFVYLFLGFVYNLWHPYWILFITIPIYYIVFDEIEKLWHKEKD